MEIVLNWIIQGTAIAIAAAAILRLIPASRAQARYSVTWAAYLLVLALPVIPALPRNAFAAPPVDLVSAAAGPLMTMPADWWTSRAVAIGLWMAWVCFQSIRLGLDVIRVRAARRRGHECPAAVLAQLADWPRVSASGRQARVIVSGDVRAAAVLGCGSPTIAVAPALVEQLDAADLDRVLVHEWAHVQRRDDLGQLAQRLAYVVAGWHPAAWWLERQLDFEREAACDEVAVRLTGSAKAYATCLTTLAALPSAPVRSMPALAAASPSRLRERIVRILTVPCGTTVRPWRAITVCGGAGLLACAVTVGNVQLVASALSGGGASTSNAASGFSRTTAPDVAPRTDRTTSSPGVVSGFVPTPPSIAVSGFSRTGSDITPGTGRTASSPAVASGFVPTPPSAVMSGFDRTGSDITPGADRTASSSNVGSGFSPPPPPNVVSGFSGSESATEVTPDADVIASRSNVISDSSRTAPAPSPVETARATWTRASDAGIAIGRASQDAGVKTAGFFSRLGRKVTDSF